jgi:hypothetical protein
VQEAWYGVGMEFSYRITNSEVREAVWLHFWNLSRKLLVGALTLITLGDIFLIYSGVKSEVAYGEGVLQALTSDSSIGQLEIFFLLIAVFAVFFVVLPWRAVRRFRKFPGSDGDLHATVTLEQLEVRVAAAGSSCFTWPLYKFWREGKKVFIVVIRSGQYQLLPKVGLTQDQRDELRSILAAALPQKK